MIKNSILILMGIMITVVMVVSGCGGMGKAKSGDTVRVHYTLKLDDGTIFESSRSGDSLQFTIGDGRLIPGFEQAVIGMKVGEEKTVKIPSAEAYGPYMDELVKVVGRDEFSADIEPEVGQELQMEMNDGRQVIVVVTEISELGVTLDANHPLAGKDLTFDIQLVDII